MVSIYNAHERAVRRGLTLCVDARNHHAVVKRPKLHIGSPKFMFLLIFRIEQGGLVRPQK